MISFDDTSKIKDNGLDGKQLIKPTKGYCLSTDAKPTEGVGNGSVLIEMDTGTIWFFDEAGGAWIEWSEGSEG
jgi:hypothetical protein